MVTRQERSRKRKFVAGWKIQGKRNRDDLWHRYTLQVAIDWSYSRSWDAENRSNVWFVDWPLWLRMASKIRCKRMRRRWSLEIPPRMEHVLVCRLPLMTCYASTPFITRHRLNGRKQTTYSPVITAEEAAKTLGRDTDEKLYLCAGFV